MKNLLFGLTAILLVFTACQKSETTPQPSNTAPSTEAAETQSDVEAKVTIVKFSDYECPACAYYHSMLKQLKQDLGTDVKVIAKHFPLSIHPYAQVAARSAEAARLQGKYDEMHDLIFAGQSQWSRGNAENIFIGYAQSLDLDIEKFRADMNSADMNRIVISDRREGMELGVNSTPTFFIEGDKINGNPSSYPEFKELVESYMD
ncbi:MAG: thioredoxin domain-containing protein [Balneolaceae bacterium]|nr:thioredoxin domain-containing protein [Balneolaceae bacterium]